MNRYRVVEEEFVFDECNKKYITYGIACDENNIVVSDITLNSDKIHRFVQLINDNDLSPVHIMDVIEDFLDELQ